MDSQQLDGISAFHVGNPNCFLLVRLDNEKQDILPMFNLEFRGYSTEGFITRNEQSIACPTIKRNIRRVNGIRVNYNDHESGDSIVERFNNTESWTLQAVGLYSIGKTICDLNVPNTDHGVETLVNEINRFVR